MLSVSESPIRPALDDEASEQSQPPPLPPVDPRDVREMAKLADDCFAPCATSHFSPPPPEPPSWVRRAIALASGGVEWLFGFVCLLIFLAVAATLPVIQLISLGYLLESAGRVARSGRLRDGFFLVRQAARLGSLVAGTWLMLLPLRLISDYWYSSHLIDAASPATRAWRLALILSTILMLAHILVCWSCGGRFRHFLWPLLAPLTLSWWALRHLLSRTLRVAWRAALRPRPLVQWFPPAMVADALRRGVWYGNSRDAVWDFAISLQLPRLFSLGLRGAAGTLVWLAVPILLLIAATQLPEGPGVLIGLLGGLLLALAMFYLPFLQTRFAAEDRWQALFQVREVRALFCRAPAAFAVALIVTLVFALPLYLLKIEMTPREVAFLPSLVFVVFIFPARLLSGWAVSRAARHAAPRRFLTRWAARLVELPVVLLYAGIVFLTGYTSWYGVWSLFEQHALLIPVPFLGL